MTWKLMIEEDPKGRHWKRCWNQILFKAHQRKIEVKKT